MNPRAFLFGIIAGIAITLGSLIFVSVVAGVKWQPVKVGTLSVPAGDGK